MSQTSIYEVQHILISNNINVSNAWLPVIIVDPEALVSRQVIYCNPILCDQAIKR